MMSEMKYLSAQDQTGRFVRSVKEMRWMQSRSILRVRRRGPQRVREDERVGVEVLEVLHELGEAEEEDGEALLELGPVGREEVAV